MPLFRRPSSPPPRQRQRPTVPQQPQQGPVFSYHASRSVREDRLGRVTSDEPPQRQFKRRARRIARRIPAYIALIIILFCVGNAITLSNNPKVIPIGDKTDKASQQLFIRSSSIYQNAAQKLFDTSIMNRNKLTVDASHITTQLKQEFPELQSVSIALPLLGHRPVVYIQPAAPTFILTNQHGGVFVLDKSGRALVSGNDAVQAAKLNLPTVHDDSGLEVRVGQIALPSNDVAFIAQVAGQLQAQHIGYDSLTLPAAASELDVKVTGVPYLVKFNMQGDAKEQAGTFIAVRQQLGGQHITPGQYIDVRVPGRAYYK
jgi:hypothetical protein